MAVLGIVFVLASCDTRCSGPGVDYTIPPAGDVLGGADALVRARVVSFPDVDEYTLDAELGVTEVLVQNADPSAGVLTEGPLMVGAYDDPCGRRTGLRFADDDEVLVVLRWVGADGTWDSPWHAYPVLSEVADGRVTFLDTGEELNQRIDQILGEPTVDQLIAVVSETG